MEKEEFRCCVWGEEGFDKSLCAQVETTPVLWSPAVLSFCLCSHRDSPDSSSSKGEFKEQGYEIKLSFNQLRENRFVWGGFPSKGNLPDTGNAQTQWQDLTEPDRTWQNLQQSRAGAEGKQSPVLSLLLPTPQHQPHLLGREICPSTQDWAVQAAPRTPNALEPLLQELGECQNTNHFLPHPAPGSCTFQDSEDKNNSVLEFCNSFFRMCQPGWAPLSSAMLGRGELQYFLM